MNQDLKTLLVFIDGIGLGKKDAEVNPLYRGDSPFLLRLLEEQAIPVDATLDVPGRPQSATGQATIFTGENAARFMGRHAEGCPGPSLKTFVREHNLFDKLRKRSYRSTFANAYYIDDLDEVQKRRRQSVSTVAALKAFGEVRDSGMLLRNEAVYQDLTREAIRARGYEGPVISPSEAASHLLAIASGHHFTVFEYFQTDLMAHRGSADDMKKVLSHLDEFLESLLVKWGGGSQLFVLISDHGNLEDSTHRLHTMNPVPLVVLGEGRDVLRSRVKRLDDLAPALLELYPDGGKLN